ncbi:MAG: tandem-95 repeat protein, partial [candidate division Zixibacteria bacterium]|nr:tandem-95 repeat protein [candidate division Zixibacteria bacterium]
DSEIVTITVNDGGNQLPVLSAIGAQSTTENVLLSFAISATDVESTPVLTTSSLPTGAVFIDNGNGTGSFDWTPDFLQSGSYNVTFYATDDSSAVDSEIVTITVTDAGNQLPVLASIGAQSTNESVNLNFGISAIDAESTPGLTTSTLPTGAVFTDNGNGTGSFDWTPDSTQAGIYNVTFYATDDSSAVDSEIVTITVNNFEPPASADTLYVDTSSSTVSITSETSARGAPDGVEASISGKFAQNFDTWTFDFDSTVNSGDVISSAEIFITHRQSGYSNDSLVLEYFDGTSFIPFESFANIPATLTTVGPFTATAITSGSQLNGFQVRMRAVSRSGGADNITYFVDAIELQLQFESNLAPVLDPIGPKAVTEGQLLSFDVTASDPNATITTLTAISLPAGASYTDNGNDTGSFSWTPGFTESGVYNVTFIASDGSLADSETVTITVNDAGNQNPVLAAIGAQSTTENVQLTFAVSATDPESTPTLTTSSLPTGASFIDNGNGTGDFSWTPDSTQAGVYNVTFFAADDSTAVDSEGVTITVNDAANLPPILSPIGPQVTTEGVLLNFNITASDPEATTPLLSTTTLPPGATFVDNANGTGTFNWTPGFTQSGVYSVTFFASDGALVDSEVVSITVNEAGNQSPVLDSIGAQSVAEGANLNLLITSSDPEGVAASLTTGSLPTGASFVDNGNGTGTFDWTPDFTQAGSYNVTFFATDDSTAVDSEVVAITVQQVNVPPVLAPIGTQVVDEGVNLNFGVSASDADGQLPILTTLTLPPGATFIDNGNGTGTFDWTPDFTQSGAYSVTFSATDDSSAVDSEVVAITVNHVGQGLAAESLYVNTSVSTIAITTETNSHGASDGTEASISERLGGRADTWTFDFDPTTLFNEIIQSAEIFITHRQAGYSNDSLVLEYFDGTSYVPFESFANVPATLTTVGPFVADSITSVGQLDGFQVRMRGVDQTGGGDNITYFVDAVELRLQIDTLAVNQPPVLAAIGAQSTTENVNLNFGISATDADATTPSLSAVNIPSGATFTDNADGTGVFDWTPDFLQSGSYNVTFIASDGTLADSEIVTITVTEAGNQLPTLTAIGAQSTNEGVNLIFGVSATDAESTPTLTTSALPTGAAFVDSGNGNGSFDWTPDLTQSGTYNVTFYATDDSATVDSEVVTITVNEVGGNQPPVLAAIGAQSTTENIQLLFGVSATDAESIPTLTTSTLPTGAVFVDSGNGSGSFDWTPTFLQSGVYNVTFYATDDSSAVDSEIVTITVNDAGNQIPVLASIGAQSTTENVLLSFGVSATDIESTPTLTTSTLPTGAVFTDNGNGTGSFDWTPDFLQSGSYNVTFYATDDSTAVDSEIVTITVNDAGNQLPILVAIGAQSTTENVLLSFGVSAIDIESTPVLTTSSLPTGAVFTDNGNGTGTFDWTPDLTQAGSYNVTFYATDDSSAVDSEVVTITVNNVNQAPVLAAIGNKSVDENVNLNFGVSATDADATTPTLSTSALPTGATFVDNLNGTGTFDWTPTFAQSGVYSVTFYAADGIATDSEIVAITVNNVNQAPVLAA